MKWLRRFDRLAEFIRREDGSYTAEMVIWTPVFALIIGLIADTSIIFGDQSVALQKVQYANRSLAVGYFTPAQAQTFLQNQIDPISPNATISVTLNGNLYTTVVTMPTRDLTATSLVSAFGHSSVTVGAVQMSEM